MADVRKYSTRDQSKGHHMQGLGEGWMKYTSEGIHAGIVGPWKTLLSLKVLCRSFRLAPVRNTFMRLLLRILIDSQ